MDGQSKGKGEEWGGVSQLYAAHKIKCGKCEAVELKMLPPK